MATAILSSRNPLVIHRRFDHQNPNPRHSTTVPRRSKQKSPTTTKKNTVVESPPVTNLVMGKVKILKRGETLSSIQNKENDTTRRPDDLDLVVDSINRLGPEPEIVKNQIGGFKGLRGGRGRGKGYAGSNCSVSPPPSSVPIPKFLI